MSKPVRRAPLSESSIGKSIREWVDNKRLAAILERNGIQRIEQLNAKSDEALLSIRGIGPKRLEIINAVFARIWQSAIAKEALAQLENELSIVASLYGDQERPVHNYKIGQNISVKVKSRRTPNP